MLIVIINIDKNNAITKTQILYHPKVHR